MLDGEYSLIGERQDPTVTPEATAQSAPAPPPVTEEEINSEAELLKSPDLLQDVVLANGLQEGEKKSLLASILPRQQEDWYVSKAVYHLVKEIWTSAW